VGHGPRRMSDRLETDGRVNASAETPSAALRRLAEANRLVSDFPTVCGIVARLAGPELARAGRLLSRLDPEKLHEAHPGLPTVTISLTGHGTIGAMVPALTAELARHGMIVRPVLAGFDSYVQVLFDADDHLGPARPDITVCVLDPQVIFDEVPVPWRPDDVERVAAAKLDLITNAAGRFDAARRGTLVLNTMTLLRGHSAQLVDHRSRARLGAVWRDVNARLLRLAEAFPSVIVLDLDPLVAAAGTPVRDERLSVYAKGHLSDDLLAAYAAEVGHVARNVAGRTKKCLVLDLDNTLWGGVLGEDGVEGIEVGHSHRGEAFLGFQRVVKQLGSQGVLIAALSKNEPDLVRQALRDHPRMVLRESDFVRVIAGWGPKQEGLDRLAAELGLSTDSFVFADDSPFERELVRREVPGVAVVDIGDDPALHVTALLRDGWFDTREVTEQDLARLASYRDDVARASFLDTFDSVRDYLRELGVRVRIAPVTEAEAPRVAQLTLRTNQFNLTAARLQTPEVLALLAEPGAAPLAVHAGDRFGDQGLVGAVLTRRDGDVLRIDNFVLSCRVFSRAIEDAVLLTVLRQAHEAGATAVVAGYRKTSRNHRVADFYPRHGFHETDRDEDVVSFRHTLTDLAHLPGHITLDVRTDGSPL